MDVNEGVGGVVDSISSFIAGGISTHTDSETLFGINGTPIEVSLSSATDAHRTNTPFVSGYHLGDDIHDEEITFSLDTPVTELRIEFDGLEFNEEFRLNIDGQPHLFRPGRSFLFWSNDQPYGWIFNCRGSRW